MSRTSKPAAAASTPPADKSAASQAEQPAKSDGSADLADAQTDQDVPTGPFLIVTGPKKGRRRGGRAFGKEPVKLSPADFADSADGPAQMLAILTDPALKCVFEGVDAPPLSEMIEDLRARIDEANAEANAARD